MLDINDVLDTLTNISNKLGDYTSRDDLKRAILEIMKIIPDWLSSLIMPNKKFLLKMSNTITKQMSPHDCNKKITVYFHAKKKAEDEQKQMYDENKKME